ncbi:hypothetical protein MASR2M69_25070 [Bacteroidota bacterium]
MIKNNCTNIRIFIPLFISLLFTTITWSQNREHLIGIRAGYSISGIDSRPTIETKSINSNQNFSIIYTYYHDLWGDINLFGFQTGISKNSAGYKSGDNIIKYEVITIPLVSQFHIDFWKMRLLLNAGGFGGYRVNKTGPDGTGFDEFDYRYDYGFIAGGGLALKLKPFELHMEGNYNYSLSYLFNPKKFSTTDYLFTYPHSLIFSLTLYVHL